ncbi:MAG: hypothetical protein KTR28_00670 [Micavibrio sp.]|nr:hypothetical protein [Micavibrio sp.]
MMEFFLDGTKLWFLFSFVVFVIGAFKLGQSKVTGLLDSRIEEIRKRIEDAENLRVEAQELLAQYQRKHRDAVSDAQNIVRKAEQQAAEIRNKAEEELTDSIERRERQLKERLIRMEQDATEEIRRSAAELALNVTAEIINAKLDKKTNDNLIQDSIKEIGGNLR